jgi:hypothetical protein
VQYEARDRRGKAAREGDREGRAAEPGEEGETLEAERLRHRAHVRHDGVDRVVGDVAIGEPEAARVEADEGMVARELGEPVPEHGAVEVELEVAVAAREHHQRRPPADHRVGDADAVGRVAEADALGGRAHACR